jgi:hypothetical protein
LVQYPTKAQVNGLIEFPTPTGSKAPARIGPAWPGTATRHLRGHKVEVSEVWIAGIALPPPPAPERRQPFT